MDRFYIFEKRSFRFKNDEEKTKNETVVFNPPLTVVNDLLLSKIRGQKTLRLFVSIKKNHLRQDIHKLIFLNKKLKLIDVIRLGFINEIFSKTIVFRKFKKSNSLINIIGFFSNNETNVF